MGVANLAVVAVCYGSGQLGLLAGEIGENVSPLWPPTGVALVALLLYGIRVLPAIAAAAFLTDLPLVPLVGVVIDTGAAAATALAGYLLLRRVGFRLQIDRLRDALALVFLAAFGSTLISSLVGCGVRVFVGQLEPGKFLQVWSVWWTGDAMGILLVTPFLLAVRQYWRLRHIQWYRYAELGLLLAASFGAAWVGTHVMDAIFLTFPIIGWAALRFQLVGVAPCALIVSVTTADAAVGAAGAFAGEDVLMRMVSLQMFNMTLVLGSLLFAAIISQRDRARDEIERTCSRLGEVIHHLEVSEEEHPVRVRPTREEPQRPSETS
ncbi:MASE1 domain-containing protein [Actinopolymorpha sp. B11F2]|uniref:MASE1 domain-containing protein n=1 Tax=Actinopolymorpha sp. B11F2 TaxID=3160862 RepID=UPI0032E4CCAD